MNIIYVRGQGADNPSRPGCDAGGHAKREHARITLPDGRVLASPSWWMGVKSGRKDAAAAALAGNLQDWSEISGISTRRFRQTGQNPI